MKKLIVLTMAALAAMMPLMATPVNDNFVDASEITGMQGTLNASNVGATSEDDEDTLHGSETSLWFKWTAPTNGNMTIDTFGSDLDTILGAYTGTGIGDLVEVALNDDADDDIRQSCVYFNAEEGVTYFIMAGGFSDNTGNIVLNWDLYAGPFEMTVVDGVVTGYRGTCPATLTAADWPEGVTEIGSDVFSETPLESVHIPASVTNIGNYAFGHCDNLVSVTFANGREGVAIDPSAFDFTPWGDANMPTVLIRLDEDGNVTENGTTLVGYHGASPVTLDIPADVTAIRYWAFERCNALQELTVPTNVTEIGEYAFSYCNNLLRAFLPKNLEGEIDESSVFEGSPVTVYYYEGDAPMLVTITLNANGGAIGAASIRAVLNDVTGNLPEPTRNGHTFLGWFTAAEGGSQVTAETVVTGDLTLYAHWEKIVYTYNYIDNGDGTVTLSHYDEHDWWVDAPISPAPVGEFTVPGEIDGKQVVAIGKDAFGGCSGMTSVVIPASVTNISWEALIEAYGLTNIAVAADNPAYKSVGGVLYTKDGKTLVTYPRGKGGNVVVAAGTECIGYGAFFYNGNLASVSFPAELRRIDERAFESCSCLQTVTFAGPEDEVDVADTSFMYTPYDATLPFALIVDGDGTLFSFHGIAPENVVFSNYLEGVELTGIGYNALSYWSNGTSSMTNVVVSEGVTWIGSYAFASDHALENVTLPESLQSISYNAFYYCTALRELRIPSGVTDVNDTLFEGCTNLTVHAPETLRGAFTVPAGCTIEYYEVPQFTVTFNANGGTVNGEATTNCLIYAGQKLGVEGYDEWGNWGRWLPTPTQNDYAFLGWFTAAEDGNEVTTETVVTSNMTLYAHWEAFTPEWYFEITETDEAIITGYSAPLVGDVEIPSSVTGEEDDGDGNVTEVTYPVTAIGEGAFYDMDGIESVTIPASVVNIEEWAFEDCSGLTNVVFVGGMASVQMSVTYAFSGTPWLEAYLAALPAPDNDKFADAETISGTSGSVTGTNFGATAKDDEPLSLEFESTATVWWRWTAPTNGTFAFSTQGSDFDTVLGVYTGNVVTALNAIAANDDSFGNTSAVTFGAVMGTTYYIAVGGYGDEVGSIVLSWGVDDVIVDVGGGKTVTVPGSWLEEFDTLRDNYGGDKTAYVHSTAVNGRKVWECYVLGLDPEMDDDFTIVSFPMNADGTPDLENIEYDPPQEDWNVSAQPIVKGAATLDGEWQTVTEQNKSSLRFFKVEVVLP